MKVEAEDSKYRGLYCVDAKADQIIPDPAGSKLKRIKLAKNCLVVPTTQLKSPLNRQTNDLFEVKLTKHDEQLTDEFNYGFDAITLPIYNMSIKRMIIARQISSSFPSYEPKQQLTRLNDAIPLQFGGFSQALDPKFNPDKFENDLSSSFGQFLFKKMVGQQIEGKIRHQFEQQNTACAQQLEECESEHQDLDDISPNQAQQPLLMKQFVAKGPYIPQIRVVTDQFNRRYDQKLEESLQIYKKHFDMKDRDDLSQVQKTKRLELHQFYMQALGFKSQQQQDKDQTIDQISSKLQALEVIEGHSLQKRTKLFDNIDPASKRFISIQGQVSKAGGQYSQVHMQSACAVGRICEGIVEDVRCRKEKGRIVSSKYKGKIKNKKLKK